VSYLLQNWTGHEPGEPYDAVTCIEATEHFASETLTPDEKAQMKKALFVVHKENESRVGKDILAEVYKATGFKP